MMMMTMMKFKPCNTTLSSFVLNIFHTTQHGVLTVQHLGDLRRDVDLRELVPRARVVAPQLRRVVQRQPDGATSHRHVADGFRLRTYLECFVHLEWKSPIVRGLFDVGVSVLQGESLGHVKQT